GTTACTGPDCPGLAVHAFGGGLATGPQTFKSSKFGFSVDYGDIPGWSIKKSGSDGVLFNTRAGQLEVVGGRTSASALQLIQQRVSSLSSAFPDLRAAGAIDGAHLGDENGVGAFYDATLTPQSGGGQALLIRVGVIVVHAHGMTVMATALAPYDGDQH